MKSSPHLPNKSCRVDTHYYLRSIKWLVFFIVLAFLSGTAAALAVAAWIAPTYTFQHQIYPASLDSRTVSQAPPDSWLVRQTRQRLITIYDLRKKTANKFYNEDAFVGQAALISSDGWAVAYLPNYTKGQEKFWQAVNHQGQFYEIEEVLFDEMNRLVFAKFAGQGFRIMSFPQWPDVKPGINLWSLRADEWQRVLLDKYIATGSKKTYSIWRPQFSLTLAPEVIETSILINGQGELAGFAKDNKFIPAWLVEGQIVSLLGEQRLAELPFDWRGHLIAGLETDQGWQDLLGFYIIEMRGKKLPREVQAGDLIVKINNQPINKLNLARQISTAGQEFYLTIYRDGEEQDVLIEK